uniref:Uncharacterized protein n=1 Tax=Arion vulgaris TaxID=1028688 RepID=A0A0B7AAB8_9EUPU
MHRVSPALHRKRMKTHLDETSFAKKKNENFFGFLNITKEKNENSFLFPNFR